MAYIGKLCIHPVPIATLEDFWTRAAIGPVPGQLVLLAGIPISPNLDHDSYCNLQEPKRRRPHPAAQSLRGPTSGTRQGRRVGCYMTDAGRLIRHKASTRTRERLKPAIAAIPIAESSAPIVVGDERNEQRHKIGDLDLGL